MQRSVILLGLAAAGLGMLQAATVTTRRANLTGSRGDEGKCTIEVVVDGAADIEVSGDMGRLRTLSGQESQWRRMECSAPLPRNPGDFRFKGVDGRGNVQLIRDPNSNRGIAVVRIEDPKGGSEGYTFDLEWRGGTSSGDSGYGNSGYGNNSNRPYGNRGGVLSPDSGYSRDPYNNQGNTPNANNDPYYRDSRNGRDAVAACEDAVRTRADREFGLRDVTIRNINVDDGRGNRDFVIGSFDARGDRNSGLYNFDCRVNLNNGRVRTVNIRPAGNRRY